MARTYAICNHNRVVLAVLGILLIMCLVSYIVCDYTCIGDCESLDILQLVISVNSCSLSTQLKAVILCVFQDMIM